jgi:predicted outer membrane protein
MKHAISTQGEAKAHDGSYRAGLARSPADELPHTEGGASLHPQSRAEDGGHRPHVPPEHRLLDAQKVVPQSWPQIMAGKTADDMTAGPADSRFLCKAVMLNMTALEAGHCAEFQSDDAGLRGLAGQMVVILGRIDTEGRQLAKRYAVPVVEQLNHQHRSELAALEGLGGSEFGQVYLRKFAIEAQLELIRLCGAELTHGSVEGLRAAAGNWLQDLRGALMLSRRLYFSPTA